MSPARLGRRTWVAIVVVQAAVVGLGGAWWGIGRRWTEARVRWSLWRELPASSDKRAVEAWFDRHGIEHGSDRSDTSGGGSGNHTFRELAGLREEDVDEIIFGEIPPEDANVSLIDNGRISIVFFFKRGRCVGRWIDVFLYEL